MDQLREDRESYRLRRIGSLAASLLSIALFLGGCRAHQNPPITLSVAASLQNAIIDAETAYQRQHGRVDFRNNFGGSGTLAREIEQGAPVDALISAGAKQVDALEQEGLLVAGTRKNLLRNSLVLIVPANSHVANFTDLAEPGVRLIALGDPGSVPAGQYGAQTLRALNLYQAISNKIVLCKDVRQVLTYVETGEADAGLVYATDARLSRRVRVVATAPETSHDPIVYPVAAIKGGRNLKRVEDFIAFLSSPAAQAIFRQYGFTPE